MIDPFQQPKRFALYVAFAITLMLSPFWLGLWAISKAANINP